MTAPTLYDSIPAGADSIDGGLIWLRVDQQITGWIRFNEEDGPCVRMAGNWDKAAGVTLHDEDGTFSIELTPIDGRKPNQPLLRGVALFGKEEVPVVAWPANTSIGPALGISIDEMPGIVGALPW